MALSKEFDPASEVPGLKKMGPIIIAVAVLRDRRRTVAAVQSNHATIPTWSPATANKGKVPVCWNGSSMSSRV